MILYKLKFCGNWGIQRFFHLFESGCKAEEVYFSNYVGEVTIDSTHTDWLHIDTGVVMVCLKTESFLSGIRNFIGAAGPFDFSEMIPTLRSAIRSALSTIRVNVLSKKSLTNCRNCRDMSGALRKNFNPERLFRILANCCRRSSVKQPRI